MPAYTARPSHASRSSRPRGKVLLPPEHRHTPHRRIVMNPPSSFLEMAALDAPPTPFNQPVAVGQDGQAVMVPLSAATSADEAVQGRPTASSDAGSTEGNSVSTEATTTVPTPAGTPSTGAVTSAAPSDLVVGSTLLLGPSPTPQTSMSTSVIVCDSCPSVCTLIRRFQA